MASEEEGVVAAKWGCLGVGQEQKAALLCNPLTSPLLHSLPFCPGLVLCTQGWARSVLRHADARMAGTSKLKLTSPMAPGYPPVLEYSSHHLPGHARAMSSAGPEVQVAGTWSIKRTRWLARSPELPIARQMAVLASEPCLGLLAKTTQAQAASRSPGLPTKWRELSRC